jgi:hypothetical protein
MRKRLYLEINVKVVDPRHFLPWYEDGADCHIIITMNILANRNAKLL